MRSSFELHHVGYLTRDINASLSFYKDVLKMELASEVVAIKEQRVRVCLLKPSTGCLFELVEPDHSNYSLNQMLNKHITYYHTGYTVEKIDESIELLFESGCRFAGRFESELFNGKECAFMLLPDSSLLELIER